MNKHKINFFIFIISFLLIWYLGRHYQIDTQGLEDRLKDYPIFYSSFIYIILYVVITFFVFFAKDIFYVLGAVLFNVTLSALLILIAEVINAFILFYFARKLGRVYVEKSLENKFKNLYDRLGKVNFIWLFIFRAVPLLPYRFLDLAAGLTKMNFKKYLAAVILGSPLKIFWIQYVLSAVGTGIFNKPYALVEYFLSNKILFIFSLVYCIVIIIAAIKITAKNIL